MNLARERIDSIRRNYRTGDIACSDLVDLLTARVEPGAERAVRTLVRYMALGRFSTAKIPGGGSFMVCVDHNGERRFQVVASRQDVVSGVLCPDGRELGGVSVWVGTGQVQD